MSSEPSPPVLEQSTATSCAMCGATLSLLVGGPERITVLGCDHCGSATAQVEPFVGYDDSYYSSSYLQYEAERTRFLDSLIARLGAGDDRILVDSGCGAGLTLDAARRAGWQAVGCEPSLSGVRLAHQQGNRALRARGEGLPLRSGCADAVLVLDVLAHVARPDLLVREAVRLLAPGGCLVVKSPHRPLWSYRFAAMVPGTHGNAFVHLPYQIHALSGPGLVELMSTAGLESVIAERSPEAIPYWRKIRGPFRALMGNIAVSLVEAGYGKRSTLVIGRKHGR
jgi:SAM-dependent methyltransferase